MSAARYRRSTRRPSGPAAASRFRRSRRNREEFAGKLVQAVTLTVLCGALIWLLLVATKLVRAHLEAGNAAQAWLLPLVIGAILLFLLYRLLRLWREVRELGRELSDSSKSMNDNDID